MVVALHQITDLHQTKKQLSRSRQVKPLVSFLDLSPSPLHVGLWVDIEVVHHGTT